MCLHQVARCCKKLCQVIVLLAISFGIYLRWYRLIPVSWTLFCALSLDTDIVAGLSSVYFWVTGCLHRSLACRTLLWGYFCCLWQQMGWGLKISRAAPAVCISVNPHHSTNSWLSEDVGLVQNVMLFGTGMTSVVAAWHRWFCFRKCTVGWIIKHVRNEFTCINMSRCFMSKFGILEELYACHITLLLLKTMTHRHIAPRTFAEMCKI